MKYILKSCCIVFSVLVGLALFLGSLFGLVWLMEKNTVLASLGVLTVAILLIAYGLKRDEERR